MLLRASKPQQNKLRSPTTKLNTQNRNKASSKLKLDKDKVEIWDA
jgi:hypothetical protein